MKLARGGSLRLWRERVIVAAMVGFLKAPPVMALVMLLCAVMAVRLAGGTRAVHMAKEESYESDGDGSSSRGSAMVLALDKGDGSQAPRMAQGLPYEQEELTDMKLPTDAMEGQVWPGGGWVPWGIRDVRRLEGNAAGRQPRPLGRRGHRGGGRACCSRAPRRVARPTGDVLMNSRGPGASTVKGTRQEHDVNLREKEV